MHVYINIYCKERRPEQDSQKRTARTGQAEKERQNRTGKIKQNTPIRTCRIGWAKKIGRTGKTEHDWQTGQAGQYRQNRQAE